MTDVQTAETAASAVAEGIARASAVRVPEGRKATDRAIIHNVVVEGTPEEVYDLWMTVDGANRFFGADAVIDGRPGGAYEIYFLPRDHPESDANATRGAKLLWAEPKRLLAFEWVSPPFAPELNTKPLPTWTEVQLSALEDQPDRTHLHLEHHGFERGGSWDPVYEIFWRWWGDILFRLQKTQTVGTA